MTIRKGSRFGLLGMGAALALGVAAAAPVAPLSTNAPTSQVQSGVVREFVAERKRRLPGRRRKVKMRDPQKSQKWEQFKNGDAIDGRGDFRSAKRLYRQRVCEKYGISSGRQWVRARRQLRGAL